MTKKLACVLVIFGSAVVARAQGSHADVTVIRAGKYADIIAVTTDPLADIHALEHVSFVMKEGKIYKQ
jgi:imidazolonepropionase-like amidohydrolase